MAKDHGDPGLASSLTDLMTSLAVIFILLLVASLNNLKQEGEVTRNKILDRLQQELRSFMAQGVEVKTDPKDPLGLLVLVPEGLLQFPLDKAVIPKGGIVFLSHFAPRLAKTVCAPPFRKEVNSIVVEGHADSSGTHTHNLELSQGRSMAVVFQSLAQFQRADDTVPHLKDCFAEFLSASGRGRAELIHDEKGSEDSARSRRVVFKIRVRSLEQRPLKEILGSPSPAPV